MAIKTQRKSPAPRPQTGTDAYKEFDRLDGFHPWMQAVPEGFISYNVRELGIGEITYFNFPLAKEMGLIPGNHPHEMTPALHEKLIKTFSIQIINEYDEQTHRKFPKDTIKANKFMATRYLQLQHPSKQGKTSGDGRGIWNGCVAHRGQMWDVSSRGTGVTRLAPGSVEANKPLKTGGDEFGYGCGLAEMDELYGAAIMAEVMHLQGIPTERVLCTVDLGKNVGIGVRAGPCLIRPAHLFIYLKQNRLEELKAATQFVIERLQKNGSFKGKATDFMEFADFLCERFAQFTAHLDIDYVFAWLDWDGDNVLIDAGIIDYGSVRQFGIRHDEYRYDDIERFSTNLNEQRNKAKLLVQNFVQIADYIKTGKKKPLREFAKHSIVNKFNQRFADARAHRLLYRMGFNENQRQNIVNERGLFDSFDREYSYFEKAKISGASQKVADGVNHPALFNMRNLLKELPQHLSEKGFNGAYMPETEFFKTIVSSFAKSRDAKLTAKHKGHIQSFQRLYRALIKTAAGPNGKPTQILHGIADRAARLNRPDRITGNALIHIVYEIMGQKKKKVSELDVQRLIDQIVYSYADMPEVSEGKHYEMKPRALHLPEVYSKILTIIDGHSEDI